MRKVHGIGFASICEPHKIIMLSKCGLLMCMLICVISRHILLSTVVIKLYELQYLLEAFVSVVDKSDSQWKWYTEVLSCLSADPEGGTGGPDPPPPGKNTKI